MRDSEEGSRRVFPVAPRCPGRWSVSPSKLTSAKRKRFKEINEGLPIVFCPPQELSFCPLSASPSLTFRQKEPAACWRDGKGCLCAEGVAPRSRGAQMVCRLPSPAFVWEGLRVSCALSLPPSLLAAAVQPLLSRRLKLCPDGRANESAIRGIFLFVVREEGRPAGRSEGAFYSPCARRVQPACCQGGPSRRREAREGGSFES